MHPLRIGSMSALGEEFRSAREARGLTLSDVAEQIHIRSVYLNAIENEDWPSIGAPVYVRGFIRTYARFLGVDAEGAVQRFNQTVPPERPTVAAVAAADERARSGPSVWAILLTLVAVVLVGFVGYEYWQYSQGNTSSAPVAETTAAPQPGGPGGGSQAASPLPPASPTATPTPAPRHQLTLRVTQPSWLRVTVDGTTQFEGTLPAGTVRSFKGSAADLLVGNAGGVTVVVDGRAVKPLGKSGDVVEQRYTL